jgi:hypothetical protein
MQYFYFLTPPTTTTPTITPPPTEDLKKLEELKVEKTKKEIEIKEKILFMQIFKILRIFNNIFLKFFIIFFQL